MMMRIEMLARLAAGLLGAALLAGCDTVQTQRIEPRSAPEAFSTYAWGRSGLATVPEASAQLVELDETLRASVSALMSARGYQLIEDPTRADMVMDYQVAVIEEQFAGDPTDSSWDAQFDSNAPSGVVELPARTGAPRFTLTLGLGRPGGMALWGGNATKLMTRPEDANERRRIIDTAVRELLESLPARVQ
ncbi:DUF4136 domain-containing protein [Microbulbifer sp. TYP-18]|uniref:DUF4136 domain-containing protein n=1 Tax=Microbulbifer sp. TYP-18 TaxID=3230024 RepID=UPI0034C67FA5